MLISFGRVVEHCPVTTGRPSSKTKCNTPNIEMYSTFWNKKKRENLFRRSGLFKQNQRKGAIKRTNITKIKSSGGNMSPRFFSAMTNRSTNLTCVCVYVFGRLVRQCARYAPAGQKTPKMGRAPAPPFLFHFILSHIYHRDAEIRVWFDMSYT
jgi:hypothetical protein